MGWSCFAKSDKQDPKDAPMREWTCGEVQFWSKKEGIPKAVRSVMKKKKVDGAKLLRIEEWGSELSVPGEDLLEMKRNIVLEREGRARMDVDRTQDAHLWRQAADVRMSMLPPQQQVERQRQDQQIQSMAVRSNIDVGGMPEQQRVEYLEKGRVLVHLSESLRPGTAADIRREKENLLALLNAAQRSRGAPSTVPSVPPALPVPMPSEPRLEGPEQAHPVAPTEPLQKGPPPPASIPHKEAPDVIAPPPPRVDPLVDPPQVETQPEQPLLKDPPPKGKSKSPGKRGRRRRRNNSPEPVSPADEEVTDEEPTFTSAGTTAGGAKERFPRPAPLVMPPSTQPKTPAGVAVKMPIKYVGQQDADTTLEMTRMSDMISAEQVLASEEEVDDTGLKISLLSEIEEDLMGAGPRVVQETEEEDPIDKSWRERERVTPVSSKKLTGVHFDAFEPGVRVRGAVVFRGVDFSMYPTLPAARKQMFEGAVREDVCGNLMKHNVTPDSVADIDVNPVANRIVFDIQVTEDKEEDIAAELRRLLRCGTFTINGIKRSYALHLGLDDTNLTVDGAATRDARKARVQRGQVGRTSPTPPATLNKMSPRPPNAVRGTPQKQKKTLVRAKRAQDKPPHVSRPGAPHSDVLDKLRSTSADIYHPTPASHSINTLLEELHQAEARHIAASANAPSSLLPVLPRKPEMHTHAGAHPEDSRETHAPSHYMETQAPQTVLIQSAPEYVPMSQAPQQPAFVHAGGEFYQPEHHSPQQLYHAMPEPVQTSQELYQQIPDRPRVPIPPVQIPGPDKVGLVHTTFPPPQMPESMQQLYQQIPEHHQRPRHTPELVPVSAPDTSFRQQGFSEVTNRELFQELPRRHFALDRKAPGQDFPFPTLASERSTPVNSPLVTHKMVSPPVGRDDRSVGAAEGAFHSYGTLTDRQRERLAKTDEIINDLNMSYGLPGNVLHGGTDVKLDRLKQMVRATSPLPPRDGMHRAAPQ
eukprot:TRINITY_DN21314_c0_g1_i1.p1 TRINITY_DN21314_c0_g1~~TRINITY_DN21314_c0_g1_i1.p1  ORF type:complete len:981 (+),score=212.08 TRINITY_DN21314_c0_g1_i1:148-3090(+)